MRHTIILNLQMSFRALREIGNVKQWFALIRDITGASLWSKVITGAR
jgi:hypothetical protein